MPLSPPHGAGDTAQRIEIGVDGGHAQFDRFEVLVGQIDALQDVREHAVLALGAAAHAIGETFAANEGLGKFVLVVPGAAIDELVHVGAIGVLGIAEDPQRRRFDIAAMLGHEGERVGTDEILLQRLIGAGGEQRGLGQQLDLQGQQIAEDAGERQHHIDARAAPAAPAARVEPP